MNARRWGEHVLRKRDTDCTKMGASVLASRTPKRLYDLGLLHHALLLRAAVYNVADSFLETGWTKDPCMSRMLHVAHSWPYLCPCCRRS